MKHAARKEFFKKMKEQYGETPEQVEERKRSTNMKILAHKYGVTGNTKKEDNER